MADELEDEIVLAMSQERPRQAKRVSAPAAPVPAAAEPPAQKPTQPAFKKTVPTPAAKTAPEKPPIQEDDEGFVEGEVPEEAAEEPVQEIGAPRQPAELEPVPLEDLPAVFRELEIERRAVFKVLSHQIARAAAEAERLSADFENHYGQDSYAEAAMVANALIDLIYSMYEKQSNLTRAAQKVIVLVGKSLKAAENGDS